MRSFILLSAFVALAFSGCGGAAPAKGRQPVFVVHGKVTYQGQPVSGADVIFKSESVERSAFGRTDADGNFQLSTFGSNDGAVAGKHSVVIMKSIVAAPSTPEAPVESQDYVPPGFEKVKPTVAKAERGLPAKYAKVESSGLMAMVNEDGSPNEVNFELKD